MQSRKEHLQPDQTRTRHRRPLRTGTHRLLRRLLPLHLHQPLPGWPMPKELTGFFHCWIFPEVLPRSYLLGLPAPIALKRCARPPRGLRCQPMAGKKSWAAGLVRWTSHLLRRLSAGVVHGKQLCLWNSLQSPHHRPSTILRQNLREKRRRPHALRTWRHLRLRRPSPQVLRLTLPPSDKVWLPWMPQRQRRHLWHPSLPPCHPRPILQIRSECHRRSLAVLKQAQ